MIGADRQVDGNFVPAHVPGIAAIDADGEAVLVDEVTDQLHLLNGSAALLWWCFDGVATVADVCFDFADELGVPFEQILADTVAVVGHLVEQGVLYDGREGAPDRSLHAHAHDGHSGPSSQSADGFRRPRLLEEPPNH